MNYFEYDQPFELEGGAVLPGITIAFHTYGRLNADKSNVVWVCHALTANSDVAQWWPGWLWGEGGHPAGGVLYRLREYPLCYGSSGPLIGSRTGEPYYQRFPAVTIRDMVRAHILLRKHLGIGRITC